jgi:O-antigen ligase
MKANGTHKTNELYSSGGGMVLIVLCILIVVSVLLFGAVDSGTLVIQAVLLAVALGIWLFKSLTRGQLPFNPDMIQLPLIAMAVWGSIQLLPIGSLDTPNGLINVPASATLSLDPYATRFFLMRLLLLLIFFAALLTFLNSSSLQKMVVTVLIAFGALLAFYSILQRVEDPNSIYGIRQPGQAIPFGTYVNRHHFAALMEMTLGLTLGVLLSGGLKRNRWPFVIVAAIVMAIAIILTGSRGGLIAMFSAIICVAAVSYYSGAKSERPSVPPIAVLAAGIAFVVLTAGLVIFLGGTDPLLRSTGVAVASSDFTTGRKDFWLAALRIFKDHPITGVGFDAFGVAYSRYDTSAGQLRVEQAHNDYLQILADGGLIAFACVVGFIYLLVKKSLSKIKSAGRDFPRGAAIGAFAGCVAVLVHSAFDFPLRTYANAFVFLTLAVIAVLPVSTRSKNQRKSAD